MAAPVLLPRMQAPPPVDHVVLAGALDTLGYPMRLQILDQLKVPRSLGDLRASPTRRDTDGRPSRAASRQTIGYHVGKLREAGMVRPIANDDNLLITDPKRLYALTEELRRLCLEYDARSAPMDVTGAGLPPTRTQGLKGPRLVLVHGVHEGRMFALKGDGPWSIGRRADQQVALDYDQFVSGQNALIERDGDDYVLTGLPSSRNGTWLNWEPLMAPTPLEVGDVVGVGRSLLVFRR